jgi:hypothetical protein
VGTKACHYETKVYGQLIGGGLYDADLGLVSNSTPAVKREAEEDWGNEGWKGR